MRLIEQNMDGIRELCEKYKVKELYVFGSVLTDNFSDESDVDFQAIFDLNNEMSPLDLYFGFKENLELLLQRDIDLVSRRKPRNPIFEEALNSTKRFVYGTASS